MYSPVSLPGRAFNAIVCFLHFLQSKILSDQSEHKSALPIGKLLRLHFLFKKYQVKTYSTLILPTNVVSANQIKFLGDSLSSSQLEGFSRQRSTRNYFTCRQWSNFSLATQTILG